MRIWSCTTLKEVSACMLGKAMKNRNLPNGKIQLSCTHSQQRNPLDACLCFTMAGYKISKMFEAQCTAELGPHQHQYSIAS